MPLAQERVAASDQTDPEVPRTSVVARVTRILDVFGQTPGPLLLEDVAAISGLPRSTTFRIMTQLVEQHWLEHGQRGFQLGPRALGAASPVQRGERTYGRLRQAAANELNDLHLATGAVVHLGVLEGGLLLYLDKLGGAALHSVPSQVGGQVPADTTPMGRAMLATLSPEQVDALALTTADRPRRGALDPADLHARLHACRRRAGLDVVRWPGTRGIVALGAPVHGSNGLVAAIGVAARGERLIPETLAPVLLAASRRLTCELGGTPRPGRRRAPGR